MADRTYPTIEKFADDIYDALCRIDMLDSTREEIEAMVFPLLCAYVGHSGDPSGKDCVRCHGKGGL